MPNDDHHHHHAILRLNPPLRSKPNPRLLSLILKAIIMSLLTSLFFLFLGVAAILLLHLCLAGRTFHRRRYDRQYPQYDTQIPNFGDADTGYSPEDLRKLPRFRYGTEPVSAVECVVCLDPFREGDFCRSLPGCCHVFHSNCIDKWLVKVPACPICRASVRFSAGATSSVNGTEECKQLWAVRV
ncbi:hypothetical protein L1049_022407 [Liquidambar formosana]|uniref:RING-type domain-containing protein n=1 Tax=Liquidambar formosana TaxID=63359 RepID=A0AAP0RCH7_LIQFO